MNTVEISQKIDTILGEARKLADVVRVEGRALTQEEQTSFDAKMSEVDSLKAQKDTISRFESVEGEANRSSRMGKPIEFDRAPAVHVKDAKHNSYSVCRMIRSQLDGKKLDGFEMECDQEYRHRAPGMFNRPGAVLMPMDLGKELRTDLNVTTGTGAVGVHLLPDMIELLRNKMVLAQAGATFLTGLSGGKFTLPRQSGAGTAYWVTEATVGTVSNQTIDSVPFVNQTLTTWTDITRKFIYQSTVDAESFVRDDLATVMAIELDRAGLNGSGSGAEPTGILQAITPTVGSADSGIGGALAFADLVALETSVANANAELGSLGYITSASVRGKLKTTNKSGSTFPVFLWEDDELNGYPAYATKQIPNNLTKSSGSNLSAIIYGNFKDLVIAQWGATEVLVNPYSISTSGSIRVNMYNEADIRLRHNGSFATISAVNYA